MRYPVPCECGRVVKAAETEAGLTLRCACGRDVAVPSLRELRNDPGRIPTARMQEADRSAPRIIGAILIAVGLALSCLNSAADPNGGHSSGVLFVSWVVSLLATAGSALITHSKGFPVWVTVLFAIFCPCAAVVILFLPDRA